MVTPKAACAGCIGDVHKVSSIDEPSPAEFLFIRIQEGGKKRNKLGNVS